MKKIILVLFFLFFSFQSNADSKMSLGLDIFNNKAQCGVCHSLKSAGAKGEIGPNLDLLKPQLEQIIYVVTNGIGVMQAWEGILSREEIEAVAYYVYNSVNK